MGNNMIGKKNCVCLEASTGGVIGFAESCVTKCDLDSSGKLKTYTHTDTQMSGAGCASTAPGAITSTVVEPVAQRATYDFPDGYIEEMQKVMKTYDLDFAGKSGKTNSDSEKEYSAFLQIVQSKCPASDEDNKTGDKTEDTTGAT